MSDNITIERHQVRITVLMKHFHKEIVEKFTTNPEAWTECKKFKVGQEFVTSREVPWEMPKGFCGWAWADIQKLVYGMARGGQNLFVTCCTDGYRPVIFKLEKMKNTPKSIYQLKDKLQV